MENRYERIALKFLLDVCLSPPTPQTQPHRAGPLTPARPKHLPLVLKQDNKDESKNDNSSAHFECITATKLTSTKCACVRVRASLRACVRACVKVAITAVQD